MGRAEHGKELAGLAGRRRAVLGREAGIDAGQVDGACAAARGAVRQRSRAADSGDGRAASPGEKKMPGVDGAVTRPT